MFNWDLLRTPLNWVTVAVIVALALLLFYLVAPEQKE